MNGTDYMVTRAADCRVLCAIIIETMFELDAEKTHGEVCAVFNVLEESTVAACAAAVNYLKPIYGMFLDTIPCGDVPDCDFAKELPVALDRGPVIVLEQYLTGEHNYVVSNPKLVDAVLCGRRNGNHHICLPPSIFSLSYGSIPSGGHRAHAKDRRAIHYV